MSLCLKRRSIRNFTSTQVEEQKIEALLKSAMQAPSARNQQPWEFYVIKNAQYLEKLSLVSNGARHLRGAPLGFLLLMKKDVPAPDMRPQDLGAATQNILLEATQQGLGAVWIGVYPKEDRLAKVAEILPIPEDLTPFCLIAIGYPATDNSPKPLRYDPTRVKVFD